MVNCCWLTSLPVMFVVIVVSIVINCLQLTLTEEIFDSSPGGGLGAGAGGGNEFRDNIHNGKFVIYDQIDRQMVESSMDEVIASGEDESFPFMTKVLPDYQHKDTQTIHTYMLPPEAEGHFNHHFASPLQLDVNDKFGYHVSGNHQIQAERPFKQPGQRNLAFKTAESIQSPVFTANVPTVTTTTTVKPLFKIRPKERPSLQPTSFIRHSDKNSPVFPSNDNMSAEKTKVPPPVSTNFLNNINITPMPNLSYPPTVSTSSSISSSSSIRAVHVPREDDKKQLIKTQKPKKYFPEPVKMTISPRFESLRIKSPEAQAQAKAANAKSTSSVTPSTPQSTFPIHSTRPITIVSTTTPPTISTPWRTNSRFPSWSNGNNQNVNIGNNNQHHHHHNHNNNNNNHQQNHQHNSNKHFEDNEYYVHGDKMPSQSNPHRYHVESPRGFKNIHTNPMTAHFTDLDDFEGTSASDEIHSVAHPLAELHNNDPLHTPTSTRIAVQNHPDLTDKQRDSLLKILESYYKLINQFNLDFRKLINDNRGKSSTSSKQNGTIIIEPISVEPTFNLQEKSTSNTMKNSPRKQRQSIRHNLSR